MTERPVPGAWLCRVRGFHSRRWAVPRGWRSVRPGSGSRGNSPQGLLFALTGVLGSGAAFPVLGNCPCHLPAAVGGPSRRGVPLLAPRPGQFRTSGLTSGLLSPPLARPFRLSLLNLRIRSPQPAFLQAPTTLEYLPKGVIPTPPLPQRLSPFTLFPSGLVYPQGGNRLRVSPSSLSPAPLHSSSHCLPPPPPVSLGCLLLHRCHVVV